MINKNVLRNLYPRGEKRTRITTTMPVETNERWRQVVEVKRGGEGALLLAFGLDLVISILLVNDSRFWNEQEQDDLEAIGEKLALLAGEPVHVADALWTMARAARRTAL